VNVKERCRVWNAERGKQILISFVCVYLGQFASTWEWIFNKSKNVLGTSTKLKLPIQPTERAKSLQHCRITLSSVLRNNICTTMSSPIFEPSI